jgi:hypothetical protein
MRNKPILTMSFSPAGFIPAPTAARAQVCIDGRAA